MSFLCYECHTDRMRPEVKVAEDAQQEGYGVVGSDEEKSVELYKRAQQLLEEANLPCKRHAPPLYCAAVRPLHDWLRQYEENDPRIPADGVFVWLPNIFNDTTPQICAKCKKLRPCIDNNDCTQVIAAKEAARRAQAKARVPLQNIPTRDRQATPPIPRRTHHHNAGCNDPSCDGQCVERT